MVSRTITTVVLVVLAVGAGIARAGENQLQLYKWWQSEDIRTELRLTPEQVTHIEETFQATLPKLRAEKAELDRLEAEISKLLRESNVDEAEVAQQIDRVEAARSALSKTRMLMLFRIHRILSVEQRAELRRLHESRSRDSGHRREHDSR